MADPAPRKPHGDQSLVDLLPSGQGGETDTLVPWVLHLTQDGEPGPVSKVLCLVAPQHNAGVANPRVAGNMGSFLPETTFPKNFWGFSHLLCSPLPSAFSLPCSQSRPSLRGTSRTPASQHTIPGEDLYSPKTESFVPLPK